MPDEERKNIEETGDDGGSKKVSDDLLTELKTEVEQLNTESEKGIWPSRLDAGDTRFCIWDGQSADGRKHASANGQEEIEPFEGATDGRYRVADMLVNEKVRLVTAASLRSIVRVKGVGAEDTEKAGKMEVLMRWVIRNKLGFAYVREIIKLAQYVFGDTPGVGFMAVRWKLERSLRLETVTLEELMEEYVAVVTENPQKNIPEGSDLLEQEVVEQAQAAAQDFIVAISDEETGDELLEGLLLQFFDHVKPARAKKMVKQLRRTGEAEFPMPYDKTDAPWIGAKRLYQDVFIPQNTTDHVRIMFEPEWLTKTQIEERAATEGWSDAFRDGVLEHEGEPGLQEYTRNEAQAETTVVVAMDKTNYRGLYQIIHAWYWSSNEDGIPGLYIVTFNNDVDVAAKERELVDYPHGGIPGQFVQREVLTSRLLDSRGLAELSSTDQSLIKLYGDSHGDYAQVSGVPPIVTVKRKSLGKLYIGPMVELPARRADEYKYLVPPPYPSTVTNMLDALEKRINEYHGRNGEDVDPQLVQLANEFTVLWWLTNLREIQTQLMQLVQEYMPEEELLRVTGQSGEVLFASRDEIQGEFDMELAFDVRDMDIEFLKAMGEIVSAVLMPMDKSNTMETSAIVKALLYRLSPELAESALKPVEQAQADELEDEMRNYGKIRGGVEPPMVDDGSQDYATRLSLYTSILEGNPNAFADLAPDKLELLQKRMEHLQFMSEQFNENSQIGRTGVQPGLSQQGG